MVGKEFRNLEGSFLILTKGYRSETEHTACPVLVWVLCAVCLEDKVETWQGRAAAIFGGGKAQ